MLLPAPFAQTRKSVRYEGAQARDLDGLDPDPGWSILVEADKGSGVSRAASRGPMADNNSAAAWGKAPI